MKFFQKILIVLCSLLPCFASVPQGSRGETRELNKKVLRADDGHTFPTDPLDNPKYPNPFTIRIASGTNRVLSYSNCTLLNSNQGFISDSFIFGEFSFPQNKLNDIVVDMEFDSTPFPTNNSELVMGFGFLVGFYGENSQVKVNGMGVSGTKSTFNSFGQNIYSSDGEHALHDVVEWSPDNSTYFQGLSFDNHETHPVFTEFPLYEPPVNDEAQTQNLKFTISCAGNSGVVRKFIIVPFWVSILASSNIQKSYRSNLNYLRVLYRGLLDGFMISWNSSVNALDKYYSTLISTGYNDGYKQGQNDGYQSGLSAGKQIASQVSYQNGYNKGYNDGSSTLAPSTTIWALFAAIAGVPTEVLNGMSNLSIWNVSILSVLFTLVFLALILWIIRKFI